MQLAGSTSWWLGLLVHVILLAGFRNRMSVLMHWLWSYVTHERGSRLIVRSSSPERPGT